MTMTAEQLVRFSESVTCLIFIVGVIVSLWSDFRVDQFRQRMFAIRDELFDYAASGAIDFNDPAYRLLRQSMNGFIRYGHQLTLFRLLLTIGGWRMSHEEPELRWAERFARAVRDIRDASVRKSIEQFHLRATDLVLRHLILGSPILMVVLLCGSLAMLVHRGWSNLRQVLRDSVARTVSYFVDPRLLEEEAARLAA